MKKTTTTDEVEWLKEAIPVLSLMAFLFGVGLTYTWITAGFKAALAILITLVVVDIVQPSGYLGKRIRGGLSTKSRPKLYYPGGQIKSRQKNGYIYLIHRPIDNMYKVGYSANVEQRLESLKEEFGVRLRVIKSWPVTNMRKAEKAAHGLIEDYRIARLEWFDLTDDRLQEFITDFNKVAAKYKPERTVNG